MNSQPHATSAAATPALTPAPSTSRYVEANGLKLHYLDYGTAGRPVMLCVHGGAAHAHWYDFVAGAYVRDFHVLAIDLRGHGDSEWKTPASYLYRDYASDLDAAVHALDLKDFVLMGHSMGGIVSQLYAATYPGRVKKLIVVDSTFHLTPERVARLRDVGKKPGSIYASQQELVSRYRLRPGHSVAAPQVVHHIARHSGRQLPDGTWKLKFDRAVYATREDHDGRPYWSRIKIPALLVRGSHSERITPEVYADARRLCPQLELSEAENTYHHVMLDNPSGFVEATRPFLLR
ncbi:MAG: alpha/beta fold hydrolase [Rhodospirillaceae bacterium]